MSHHVTLSNREAGGYCLLIDGKDISNQASYVSISLFAGEKPTVTLQIPVDDLDVDLPDAEVSKE